MKKVFRILQIIFSLLGIAGSVILIGFAGMASGSAMSSPYSNQAIAATLFFLSPVIALIIFIISLFKPKVLICLFAVPVIMSYASSLENTTYDIKPEFEDLQKHKRIGSELVIVKKAYLVSNLPKKRLRNYSFVCKHDIELSDRNDDRRFSPKEAHPTIEEVEPNTTFKIVGAFNCERDVYLSLKDEKGRLIEVPEFYADYMSK